MEQKQLYRGGDAQPYYLATPQMPWAELGTITAAQDYPAVDARDYPTVQALTATKRIVWPISKQASGFMLRFQTKADADATVVSLLGFASQKMLDLLGNWIDDHALYLGALTLTGGKQVGPHSNVYVDTIVASNAIWSMSEMDSGNDRIAVVRGDTKGIKTAVIIATTLQESTTLYVEGRTY
jgi:hypothetical protein